MSSMRWSALVLTWVLAACSSPSSAPQVGSESHWLRACAISEDCEGELACVCGACTRRCSGDDRCGGDVPAACFDRRSPLLLQRCESAPEVELSAGVCLRECGGDVECADGRACVEGACVPRVASDPVIDFDASAADPGTASLTPAEIDALLTMTPEVDSSTPVQTPRLQPQIEGANASLVGHWVEEGCAPGDPPLNPPWGCLTLTFEQGPEGDLVGTLQVEREGPQPEVGGVGGPVVGGFPPAEDPDVGYPPGADLDSIADIAWNMPAGVPYRVLDGRFERGQLSFVWSLMDLWHGWCSLQTSYRWMIDDHSFSFCVPQDRTLWSSMDEIKVALCTSSDFDPLCSQSDGSLIPCSCVNPDADCSYAYCRCDDAGCDADVHIGLAHATFTVDGDSMVGGYANGVDSWSGTLRRGTP